MKTKKSHQHIHALHFHGSMLVAIVAILVAATKTSSEMTRSLTSVAPVHSTVVGSLEMRHTETAHQPVMVSLSKLASNSGE